MQQRDTIIPDIHGDEQGLLDSLERARCIEPHKKGKPLNITTEGNVILLGDLNDRGPDDLGVNDRILELMNLLGDRLIAIAGNHEILKYRALRSGNAEHLARWLNEGGMTVLRSIAKRANLLLSHPAHSPFPADISYLPDNLSKDIRVRWNKQLRRRSAERYDFPAALELAKELFNGPYQTILERMKIVHEVRSNVWAVHAGIDAECAQRGPDALNAMFAESKERGLATFNAHHPLNPIIWMRQRNGRLLSDETSRILEKHGVDVLIRGHQHQWRPTLERQRNISVLHADVAISRSMCKKRRNNWAYAEFNGDDLFVDSNTGGLHQLGYNDGDKFVASAT